MPHPIESSETATARQNETRYRIDETFSNFRTVDGLMLPLQYVLKFTAERGDGQTQLNEWDLTEDQVSHNVAFRTLEFRSEIKKINVTEPPTPPLFCRWYFYWRNVRSPQTPEFLRSEWLSSGDRRQR